MLKLAIFGVLLVQVHGSLDNNDSVVVEGNWRKYPEYFRLFGLRTLILLFVGGDESKKFLTRKKQKLVLQIFRTRSPIANFNVFSISIAVAPNVFLNKPPNQGQSAARRRNVMRNVYYCFSRSSLFTSLVHWSVTKVQCAVCVCGVQETRHHLEEKKGKTQEQQQLKKQKRYYEDYYGVWHSVKRVFGIKRRWIYIL